MATWVTRWGRRQSRSVKRPRTVAGNSATSWARPSLPAGIRTQAVTCALCTSSAAGRSTITSTALLLSGAPKNTSVARQEPPKQTSLMSVLKGNSPGIRGRLPRQTSHGLTGTIENAASADDPSIIAHFHRPRVARPRGELAAKPETCVRHRCRATRW